MESLTKTYKSAAEGARDGTPEGSGTVQEVVQETVHQRGLALSMRCKYFRFRAVLFFCLGPR